MGLDMYLNGRKTFWGGGQPKEDGYRITQLELELGYWRKHPNLHGYIVKTFADGVDECQVIELDRDKIQNIIKAIEESNLPHTTGFFFGTSYGDEKEEDLKIFNAALEWLDANSVNEYRTVYYQASW